MISVVKSMSKKNDGTVILERLTGNSFLMIEISEKFFNEVFKEASLAKSSDQQRLHPTEYNMELQNSEREEIHNTRYSRYNESLNFKDDTC